MSDEVDTQCDAESDGRCSLDAGHEGKHQTRTAAGFLHTWANKFTLEADPIDDDASGDHDWEKSNLITRSERGRLFDTYRCKACSATAKRHGLAWPPALDAKQPKKCNRAPAAKAAPTAKPTKPTARAITKDTQLAPGNPGAVAIREAFTTRTKAKPMTLPQNKKILGYRRHPAAALWPMLEEDELAELVESIKARGQLDDIVLVTIDGETWILDGSNRGRACEIAGIKPRFSKYTGKKDINSLLDYVAARNDRRRHTTKSVRAMIAAESAKLRHGERQTGSAAGVTTQAQAAKGKDVSERLVRKAVKVRDEATPRIKEAVMRGKLTVEAAEAATQLTVKQQDELAERAIAKGGDEIRAGHVRSLVKQEGKREIIRKINTGRVAPMPMGPFGVIYGDYSWLYDNSDQHEGSRGHTEYPGMPMPEILAHARATARRAATDCVIALWFTNYHVREIGAVVDAYGASHHTMWTWPKTRAGVGTWGRGQTEHLVIASIGNPVHTLNEVSTLLPAYELREHSRKPDEVAALLTKHCSGPFLELFARQAREGWEAWGAETQKFDGGAAEVVEPKRKSKILTATDARMGTSSPT